MNGAEQKHKQPVTSETRSTTPLTQLRLGRAYRMIGDKEHAAQAYSEAARIWKDCRPRSFPLREIRVYPFTSVN
jgi:hypothetical protein